MLEGGHGIGGRRRRELRDVGIKIGERFTSEPHQIDDVRARGLLFSPDIAAWATFRKLPLTDAEFQTIASNVPPYMR